MENFGYVKKISEDEFIVKADIDRYGSGYGVISREQAPECAYDIDEVRQYVAEHPEMLFEHYNNEPDRSKDDALNELAMLEEWFVETYDNQVKQYERCVRLGVPFDNRHGTIEELDALATQKAKRIKELRALIHGGEGSLKFVN